MANAAIPPNVNLGIMIYKLDKHRRVYMREKMAPYEITEPMYLFIRHLHRFPNTSQDYFATSFLIDKGTVARTAKKLEDMGYITRKPVLMDKRQYDLALTASGIEISEIIGSYLMEWEALMSARLGESEKDSFISSTLRLTSDTAPALL